MTPRSSLRYRLEYAGLLLFNACLRMLPAGAAICLGRCAGSTAKTLLRSRVRLAHENLRTVFGDSLTPGRRDGIIQELFCMLGEGFVESIISSPEDVSCNLAIDGMEHLEKALAEGRGAIVLGPHMGMWELAAAAFARHFKNAATFYKPLKNPYVDAWVRKTRSRSSIELISSRQGLRRLYQYLKKDAMIVLLFDQNAGRNGVPVPFFGKTASTYAAPAAFALKTGCPVVPGYTIKEPGLRRSRMVLRKPFPLIKTGDMQQDIIANTRQYNAFIEELVRRYPEQWFGWVHHRWRLPRSFDRGAAGGHGA